MTDRTEAARFALLSSVVIDARFPSRPILLRT
jgi:hypothetical protein